MEMKNRSVAARTLIMAGALVVGIVVALAAIIGIATVTLAHKFIREQGLSL